jgi:hypothetical protein
VTASAAEPGCTAAVSYQILPPSSVRANVTFSESVGIEHGKLPDGPIDQAVRANRPFLVSSEGAVGDFRRPQYPWDDH